MRARNLGVLCLLVLAGAGPASAGRAHEHGVARLDIGVEAGGVILQFDTPLDNLLGFERAPRTDAERRAAAAAVNRLREADKLFRFDAAAGCTGASAELTSAALGLGSAAAPTGAQAGHADLEATYLYRCADGARARFVDLGLFDALPRLQRLEVQVVTPRGQSQATLRRPNARVTLVR